jgi:predicted PhzF superfamily epimerase YddE/YHI9
MSRYVLLDVFTDTPLDGNQLAVFPDAAGLTPEQMQRLAREFNFSETLFVLPPEGEGDARVRIFTPVRELPFAGHPVLGCAFHLARHGRIAFGEQIEIHQGAEVRRLSTLYARVDGSKDRIERVEVGGSAVVVAHGEFNL